MGRETESHSDKEMGTNKKEKIQKNEIEVYFWKPIYQMKRFIWGILKKTIIFFWKPINMVNI